MSHLRWETDVLTILASILEIFPKSYCPVTPEHLVCIQKRWAEIFAKKDDFDVIGNKRIPIIKLQQVDASTTFSSPFTESKGRDDPL